jgi:hypothetical protein
VLYDIPDFAQPIVPTRGPHHQIATKIRYLTNVPEHGVRRGEIDTNVDSLEVDSSQPRAVGIRVDVQNSADLESACRSKLGHCLAHLPMAKQYEIQRWV